MKRIRAGAAALLMLVISTAVPGTASNTRSTSTSPGRPPQRAPAIIDNTTRMDRNNLDMAVTNHGSFAYDLITSNAGLVYPKGSTNTVVFAAGPWLGGTAGRDVRVAGGSYPQELVPGPLRNGPLPPDQPRF